MDDNIFVNFNIATTPPQDKNLKRQQKRQALIEKKNAKRQNYLQKKQQRTYNNRNELIDENVPITKVNEDDEIKQLMQGQNEPTQQKKTVQKFRRPEIKIDQEPLNLPKQSLDQVENLMTGKKFEDIEEIHPYVKRALSESGFVNLTQIQELSMPKIFKDENVIIKSITGSGKTLSYLVPIYTNLLKMEPKVTREKGTLALVICPTRELCIQCIEVCQKCGKRAPNIVEGGLMGGENPKKEKARLRKGVGILVGTPGRILYHLQNSQSFRYSELRYLVFEECDRILDLGFQKEVDGILEFFKELGIYDNVQKILVSANIPNIQTMDINKFSFIGFTEMKKEYKIPTTLMQYYTVVEEHEKLSFLLSYAISHKGEKSIVFVSTCHEVEFFAFILERCEFLDEEKRIVKSEIFKLHGNIMQRERSETYFKFKKSTNQDGCLLISTQVASRGLDFPQVKNILLFDPPDGYEDYINKVGRTARINQDGNSLVLLSANQEGEQFMLELQEKFEQKVEFIDKERYFKQMQSHIFNELKQKERMPAKYGQQAIRRLVNQDEQIYQMARNAYVSMLKALGRMKQFTVKGQNLLELSKGFGLSGASQEQYKKVNTRDKYREMELKKRKVTSEKVLNKMEFI